MLQDPIYVFQVWLLRCFGVEKVDLPIVRDVFNNIAVDQCASAIISSDSGLMTCVKD